MEILELVGYCFGVPAMLALILSRQRHSQRAWLLSLAATAAVTATILAVALVPPLLPKIAFVDALKWNWIGKLASIAATLAIYLLLPAQLKVEAGLFQWPRPAEWASVAAITGALLVLFLAAAWIQRGADRSLSAETLAFQALLPGLDEEASFRGVVLALLVGAFGKPWKVAGINIGWGALPIVAFFGLAHGFSSVSAGVSIDWTTVALTGVTGAGLLWLKERTGSIWVPVLVHNLLNVGSFLIVLL